MSFSIAMQNIEIHVPSGSKGLDVVRAIDCSLAELDLHISLRGTLKKFPGCEHWHLRNTSQSGTLELTFWPAQHRAWLTVQSGRAAAWITDRLPEVRQTLDRHLAKLPK